MTPASTIMQLRIKILMSRLKSIECCIMNRPSAKTKESIFSEGSITTHYTVTDIVIGKGSYAIVKLGYLNSSASRSIHPMFETVK